MVVSSVDIINLNTKASITSDKNGNFKIAANVFEVLIFISEEYHDTKVKITHENVAKNLIINLIKKPIELDEVNVDDKSQFKMPIGYNDIKMTKLEKDLTRPKVIGVYTGEMVNAMDFVQIGKSIWKLLKGKKKNQVTKDEEIDYQEFIASVFNEEFFTKTLQIQPDQINLFLEYCLADDKVIEVISKKNKFEMMNVLIIKNEEFKKLK